MTRASTAQKPSIPLFLTGLAFTAIAIWMAWDGIATGLIDVSARGIHIHVAEAENPLGFWLTEAGIVLFGLFFLAGGIAALRPRRSVAADQSGPPFQH